MYISTAGERCRILVEIYIIEAIKIVGARLYGTPSRHWSEECVTGPVRMGIISMIMEAPGFLDGFSIGWACHSR